MTKKKGDYEVGYGKPPKANRFQPGESGNRSGRPKKPRSSNELFEHIMSEKITIVIRGRRRKATMKEVLIRQLVAEGLKGNQRALKALLNRESERILDEDARIAEQKKQYQEFGAELDAIAERIRKRRAKEAAAQKGDQNASSANEHRPLVKDKIYGPGA